MRSEFNAYQELAKQAAIRAEWAAALSTPAPKRTPQNIKPRSIFARLFGL